MISVFGIALALTISSVYAHFRLVPPHPNEVILLDSRESGWKSWTKNTVSDIGWQQQSRPGAGYTVFGLCEASNNTERDEFWLFGPLIPLGRALSVHVQVNFMLRSCTDSEIAYGRGGNCRENFDVLLQQEVQRSDMDAAEIPRIESFKKLATVSSDRKWSCTYPSDDTAVTSWLIRFRPQTGHSLTKSSTSSAINGWMRLAIRDQGACLMLDRIRIYFLSCPAWQVGFMILPETPAGHDAEVREVQGHCVIGAEPVLITQADFTESEPLNQSRGLKPSFCKANGQWHVLQDNVCECLSGFESSVEENVCISCPIGTYKPNRGIGFCRPCPPNSTSEASIASKRCVCSHPLYVWQSLADDTSGVCSPKLPRISNIEIVEKNAERIIITWKTPFAPDISILVAIACLNCQKDEAVYVPGNILAGNQVTVLGLRSDMTYTFSFRSCLNKDSIPNSCDLRTTHLTVKQGQYPTKKADSPNQNRLRQNVTERDLEEVTPVITIFHVLLGFAVFVCMTLLFVFGTVFMHRYYKSRPRKNLYESVNNSNQPTNETSPTATEYRNALFQAGRTKYRQLETIDPSCIEIVKSLGKCRGGETFIGQLKLAPSIENNTLRTRKIFLRPAFPKTAIDAAEIASSVKHSNIVFCHGILRAIQPPLLVYNFMTFGRLDKFLISEIGRMDELDPNGKDTIWPQSPLLSTKMVFQMLHQIISAFSFLITLHLEKIRLDSSTVMVSSDYSCKIQLKICQSEPSSLDDMHLINELDLKKCLADFLGPRYPNKIFAVQEGHHILSQSNASMDSPSPSRLFQSLIWSLKSKSNQDYPPTSHSSLASATVVKKFGWIQIELLLAAVFLQRCILRSFGSSCLPNPIILDKFSRISRILNGKNDSWLLEDVISLVSRWFGNEFLGCIMKSCLDPESTRCPSLAVVEHHLKKYLSDNDAETQEAKVTAVIRKDDMLSLPVIAPVVFSSQTTKWNNLHLTTPCNEPNPFHCPDTV